eukprot:3452214-Alexandrium_andersonii.AAC.1
MEEGSDRGCVRTNWSHANAPDGLASPSSESEVSPPSPNVGSSGSMLRQLAKGNWTRLRISVASSWA